MMSSSAINTCGGGAAATTAVSSSVSSIKNSIAEYDDIRARWLSKRQRATTTTTTGNNNTVQLLAQEKEEEESTKSRDTLDVGTNTGGGVTNDTEPTTITDANVLTFGGNTSSGGGSSNSNSSSSGGGTRPRPRRVFQLRHQIHDDNGNDEAGGEAVLNNNNGSTRIEGSEAAAAQNNINNTCTPPVVTPDSSNSDSVVDEKMNIDPEQRQQLHATAVKSRRRGMYSIVFTPSTTATTTADSGESSNGTAPAENNSGDSASADSSGSGRADSVSPSPPHRRRHQNQQQQPQQHSDNNDDDDEFDMKNIVAGARTYGNGILTARQNNRRRQNSLSSSTSLSSTAATNNIYVEHLNELKQLQQQPPQPHGAMRLLASRDAAAAAGATNASYAIHRHLTCSTFKNVLAKFQQQQNNDSNVFLKPKRLYSSTLALNSSYPSGASNMNMGNAPYTNGHHHSSYEPVKKYRESNGHVPTDGLYQAPPQPLEQQEEQLSSTTTTKTRWAPNPPRAEAVPNTNITYSNGRGEGSVLMRHKFSSSDVLGQRRDSNWRHSTSNISTTTVTNPSSSLSQAIKKFEQLGNDKKNASAAAAPLNNNNNSSKKFVGTKQYTTAQKQKEVRSTPTPPPPPIRRRSSTSTENLNTGDLYATPKKSSTTFTPLSKKNMVKDRMKKFEMVSTDTPTSYGSNDNNKRSFVQRNGTQQQQQQQQQRGTLYGGGGDERRNSSQFSKSMNNISSTAANGGGSQDTFPVVNVHHHLDESQTIPETEEAAEFSTTTDAALLQAPSSPTNKFARMPPTLPSWVTKVVAPGVGDANTNLDTNPNNETNTNTNYTDTSNASLTKRDSLTTPTDSRLSAPMSRPTSSAFGESSVGGGDANFGDVDNGVTPPPSDAVVAGAVVGPATNINSGIVATRRGTFEASSIGQLRRSSEKQQQQQQQQLQEEVTLPAECTTFSRSELEDMVDAARELIGSTPTANEEERNRHIYVVRLERPGQQQQMMSAGATGGGVGVVLTTENNKVLVSKVISHSLAHRQSDIANGDRILIINGTLVDLDMHHREALQVLKMPRAEVVMVLQRGSSGSSSNSSATEENAENLTKEKKISFSSENAYNFHQRLRMVQLVVDNAEGLGLSVDGGRLPTSAESGGGNKPLVIRRIFANSPAGRAQHTSSSLNVGDEILEINGQVCSSMTKFHAWDLLKSFRVGQKVTLKVRPVTSSTGLKQTRN